MSLYFSKPRQHWSMERSPARWQHKGLDKLLSTHLRNCWTPTAHVLMLCKDARFAGKWGLKRNITTCTWQRPPTMRSPLYLLQLERKLAALRLKHKTAARQTFSEDLNNQVLLSAKKTPTNLRGCLQTIYPRRRQGSVGWTMCFK